MTKERKSNKEAKKKPLLTMKEKKAAKQARKDGADWLGITPAKRTPGNAPVTRRP